MTDKVVLICRGVPGSGKSTIAKQYTTPENIYSTDDYWGPEYKFDIARIGVAHLWNQDRVVDAMRAGKTPIVVDNTNTVWREIEPYALAAVRLGYRVIFLEPNSPWWHAFKSGDVVAATKAFAEKNVHKVPLYVIEKMIARWQSTEDMQKRYEELRNEYDKRTI